jgi:hypothetical protein
MFANIRSVYNTLKNLANKDQRGFVTPQIFNQFAYQAQLNIYNSLFRELEQARRSSRQGISAKRDKSRIKQVEEDLSVFAKRGTVSKSNGVFAKPVDLSRIISMTTFGSVLLGQSTRTVIDVCYDEDKIERILLSDISAPSESAPVALVSSDIEVFPSQINKISVRYYKIPESRNDDATYSASEARPSLDESPGTGVPEDQHFELPAHYEAELAMELAKMIGLNLRDADIVNYSMKEELPKVKK